MKRLCYLTTVQDQYGSTLYEAVQSLVKAYFPIGKWEVIEQVKENWTDEQWSDKWPRLLSDLHAVVVWPRSDDSIDLRCMAEINGCMLRRFEGEDVQGHIISNGGVSLLGRIRPNAVRLNGLLQYPDKLCAGWVEAAHAQE